MAWFELINTEFVSPKTETVPTVSIRAQIEGSSKHLAAFFFMLKRNPFRKTNTQGFVSSNFSHLSHSRVIPDFTSDSASFITICGSVFCTAVREVVRRTECAQLQNVLHDHEGFNGPAQALHIALVARTRLWCLTIFGIWLCHQRPTFPSA